ncbi:LamG-like jellyroll fold domain-containing protein [Lutibacter sp. B1]|uniref:LamG-like jellyroll fold domain-containing protein n=1 Tax=Lutibacter sp. B1 TaxID=2725996 RepID=UPI001456EE6F|nr:LamG-like jellyroll fold domain-containing protein [Lutibacter sp. B1]NLP57043.1 T9SS type A sorting domain-containing protein [Lutibacter sp. B1]
MRIIVPILKYITKIRFQLLFFVFCFIGFNSFSQTTVIYSEDFESGFGGWSNTQTTNGDWLLGNNTAHSTGASGNYFYSEMYEFTGRPWWVKYYYYNNDTYVVATSPTIDFTGYSNIVFQFDIWFDTEVDWDGMKVEYSLDNGLSWSDLGSVANTNWYNDTDVDAFNNGEDGWSGDSGGWVTKSINLSLENGGFDNNSQVKFRILFASSEAVQDTGVAFDNIIIVSTKYCLSYGNDSDGYYTGIKQVKFNTIDNSEPDDEDNDYSDFTSQSTTVLQGSPYDLTVNVNTDGNYTVNVFAWIDWNQDGDFDDVNEEYDLGTAKNVNNGITSNSPYSITVPLSASVGSTIMRVSVKWDIDGADPTSCEKGFDGEVEDYTINIEAYIPRIDFDGTDDYVDFGDNHDLTGNFSIEAWVFQEATNSSSRSNMIVTKGTSSTSVTSRYWRGYCLDIDYNNYPRFRWWDNSGNLIIDITTTNAITNNQWRHLAVTYDGTTATLYIDGISVGNDTFSGALVNNNFNFIIGAMYYSYSSVEALDYFNGAIQEVRIWDTALSEVQIREMMNQHIENDVGNVKGEIIPLPISGGLQWSNLKGYYPLINNTATDYSVNSINGSPKNITTQQKITAPLPYVAITNSDWDTAGTWLNNADIYVPNTTGIDGSTSIDWNIVHVTENMQNARDITVLGLLVDADKELEVDGNTGTNTGYSLTVTNYLKLDGVIDLEGESQLIQIEGSVLDDTSSGYIERDQQGEGNRYRYNYWCSPVIQTGTPSGSSFTIASVLKDGTYTNTPKDISFISGYDGAPATASLPIQIANYWLYKFVNRTAGDYSQWLQIGSTGSLNAGEGFTMKGPSDPGPPSPDQNYVFVGKPNNGDIELNITSGNNYLVGNPYPSALDADQFIDDNTSISGTLYFWEHYGGDSHYLADYEGSYATYTKSGATPAPTPSGITPKTPERYIPVGQGFFVYSDVDDKIKFNNGQRIFVTEANPDNSIFMKEVTSKKASVVKNKNVVITDTRQKIRIGFGASKTGHRQLLLTVDDRTTDLADWGFDGEIYGLLPEDMFWIIDDKKYVIQGLPDLNIDREIPLGIIIDEDGLISIKIDKLENIEESKKLYIKDNLTGETYQINKQSFEIELEAGEYLDRFSLVFQPRLKTLEEIKLEQGFSIFTHKSQYAVQVKKIIDAEILSINLYNIYGRMVQTWEGDLGGRHLLLPIRKTTTGVYIVQLNTANGTFEKKIIIE